MTITWQQNLQRAVARLNPYQRAIHALVLGDGPKTPLRVVACAGAGKSATVVATVADGLATRFFGRGGVIVTTFTRKAGDELVARLSEVVEPGILQRLLYNKRIGTFHSLALNWLSKNDPRPPGHRWDPSKNLRARAGTRDRALPSDDMLWDRICSDWSTIPGTKHALDPGKEAPGLNLVGRYGPEVPKPRLYSLQIGILRSKALTPFSKDGEAAARKLQGERNRAGLDMGEYPEILTVWRLYEEAKQGLGAYDFEDAIYAYWERGTDSADLVIVDEAQDNSWIQLDLARKLAERGRGRLVLVGDVRQAIYGFRGADPEIMQRADETLGAITLEIPTNYRSGSAIVDVGNLVAEGRAWAVGSPAVAARKTPTGETPSGLVRVRGSADAMAEATETFQEVKKLLDLGVPPSACAVLVRTNAGSGPYEMAALLAKIPVMVVGASTSFFERGLIKDVTSLLLLAGKFGPSSKDDRLSALLRYGVLYRLDETAKKRFSYMKRVDLEGVLARVAEGERVVSGMDIARRADLFQRGRNAGLWLDHFDLLRAEIAAIEAAPWPECCRTAAVILAPQIEKDGVPLPQQAAADSSEDTEGSAQTEEADEEEASSAAVLRSFLEIANQFASGSALRDFAQRMAEWIQAMSSPGNKSPEEYRAAVANRVIISTIHKAKGLEFKHVWTSSTKGTFPSPRAIVEGREDEELRLFYVAVTRAEDSLTATCAARGNTPKAGGPSSFIESYVQPYIDRMERGVPRWADVEAATISGWALVGTRAQCETVPARYVWRQADAEIALREILTEGQSQWGVGAGVYPSFTAGLGAARQIASGSVPEIEGLAPSASELKEVLQAPLEEEEGAITQADVRDIPELPPLRPGTPRQAFIAWLRARPGFARDGMTWAEFATWLEQREFPVDFPPPAPKERAAPPVATPNRTPARPSTGRPPARPPTRPAAQPQPGGSAAVIEARNLVAGSVRDHERALGVLTAAGYDDTDPDVARHRFRITRYT